jgi:carboxypeptidase PM20D1
MGAMRRLRVKRALLGVLAVVALLFAVLVVRALTLGSRQPQVAPLADPPVDANAVAGHLAGALRHKTISESQESPAPAAELEGLRAHLAEAFPAVHAKLGREIVGEHSLLFTWKGTDAALAPIVLCAHQDVVPIEPGTEASWTKPPFDGVTDGGFLWGRGTIDDKGSLVAILEAVEALLGEGFSPKRTVLLAFGHDEEIAGKAGAGKIVDLLASRGVRAEVVLDEGNPLVEGIVPSIAAPVAPIGIAEKGYLTVDLSIDVPGGHSSTPTQEAAIGLMVAALDRLRGQPMPPRLDGATAEFFAWAAPEMPFGDRVVMANTWLTWPLVARIFSGAPALDASIRTTTALTVVKAGVKDNVVPRTAQATVNFRVLPGDTTEVVVEHVRHAVSDPRIKIEPRALTRTEPTRVSKTTSRAFASIAQTVREVFPGTVVAPALFLGATDGRQYERIADDIYRFVPFRLASSDLSRIHGTDERLPVQGLADAVRFYRRLVRLISGA